MGGSLLITEPPVKKQFSFVTDDMTKASVVVVYMAEGFMWPKMHQPP
jgi:hypothetical protein